MADANVLVFILLFLVDRCVSVVSCPGSCECLSAEVVDCSKRRLTSWPSGIPSTVTHLDLSQNSLTDFSRVSELQSLIELDISANGLSDINSLTSDSIRRLNLSHNQLTNDQGLLDSLPNLRSLDLAKNRLTNWYSLTGQRPLTSLDLSGNEFKSDTVKDLLKLPNLEILNISDSRLLSLNAENFKGVPRLQSLILRNSELKDIDPKALAGLSSLNVLDLSHNSALSALDTKIFQETPNLKMLKLEEAKLLCDCRAADLKDFYINNRIDSDGPVTCVIPKPLSFRNILTTDMSEFCSDRATITTTPTPVYCVAPGLQLINLTSTLAWFKVNSSYDVTIKLHRHESSVPAIKRVSGSIPFFVSFDADEYTLCAFIDGCQIETCRLVSKETPGENALLCPECSHAAAIGITVFVMLLLYIPLFFIIHRLLFILGKRCHKRPSQEAPRADVLGPHSTPKPAHNNNNRALESNHFNRSYIDLASDDIIWGKKYSPPSQYQSRENVNVAPNYEELLPDSESTSSGQLVDQERDKPTPGLVLTPGQLGPSVPHHNNSAPIDKKLNDIDRNSVFGNKYGTPHYNKSVPGDMYGPGNYEDLYDEVND